MAAAFESSGEELVHNFSSHIVVDETTWHYQNVGVVVLTNEMSDLRNPAQTSTYLLVLVQRNANTLTRTADSDTRINLATFNALSQCVTEIGIIDTCVTPGTIVLNGITLLFQVLEYELL